MNPTRETLINLLPTGPRFSSSLSCSKSRTAEGQRYLHPAIHECASNSGNEWYKPSRKRALSESVESRGSSILFGSGAPWADTGLVLAVLLKVGKRKSSALVEEGAMSAPGGIVWTCGFDSPKKAVGMKHNLARRIASR